MSHAPDLSDFSKQEIRDTLNEIRHPFEIAVYHSKNEFNLGAIIRVCHNFLVKKIWAIDIDWYYPKATMGSHKFENIEKISLENFLAQTKDRNLVAFERRYNLDTQDLRRFVWPQDPILIFGSENGGVPDEVLTRANALVSIPQYGVHNDFNVHSAASIAIYDWISKNAKI